MQALKNLLHGIVDYAGLFPPAGLAMKPVVENFRQYLTSESSWMLGRLIIPATRLAEFEAAANELDLEEDPTEMMPWRISALIPSIDQSEDFENALKTIHEFNHRQESDGFAIVDTVEGKATNPEQVLSTASALPPDWNAFLEIPYSVDPNEHLQQIKSSNETRSLFAKIRTGAVTPELIPSVCEVARFIKACADYEVGFKATAGLHHPLRSEYRLTYEMESPHAPLHGFLNVFVAACMAAEMDIQAATIESILNVKQAYEFQIKGEQIRWHDLQISPEQVERVRNKFAISFGSCSFEEPVDDLEKLNLLP